MGRRDFLKQKIRMWIFALFLALSFTLIMSLRVEAADNRVGHIYCNFEDASPNDNISDFAINQEYIFSNQKIGKMQAYTAVAPTFSIFKVDKTMPYIGNKSQYDDFYYKPAMQNSSTKKKGVILNELSSYTNMGYEINAETEISGQDDLEDELTVVSGMKTEDIQAGVTVMASRQQALVGEGATISYISDKTPAVIILFENPKIIVLTHYETPGWYVSTANGLYSYLGPMRPYRFDRLEYKLSDVKVSKSEKWVDASGSKVVTKDDLIVSVKVGNKYYEISDYRIDDDDNTVNADAGDGRISLILGEGSEEYVITRDVIDLNITDDTGALDYNGDTIDINDGTLSLTAEERLKAAYGGSVSVGIVKSEDNISDKGKNAILRELSDGREWGQAVEVSVVKRITESDGRSSEVNITEPSKLIHVRIPLISKLAGRTDLLVYRYHKGLVDVLDVTKNSEGEYFVLSDDGTYLDLFSKKFSDYVITYIGDARTAGEKIDTSTEVMPLKSFVKSPKTGDREYICDYSILRAWLVMFSAAVVLIVKVKYSKRVYVGLE